MVLSQNEGGNDGLGNRTLLDKVDRLRELGVSATIPLPQVRTYLSTNALSVSKPSANNAAALQIVVAGEQSAGKSSLLESLTGFSFPRSVSLCTRFATEIVCRREAATNIIITIHPDAGCTPQHAEKVRQFRRSVDGFTGDAFAEVFRDVCPLPLASAVKAFMLHGNP